MKIYLIILLQILVSCTEEKKSISFDFFLNEPCMIVNVEQDNTIEGTYLRIEKSIKEDSVLIINLPDNFYLNNSNCSKWILGWGTNKPLYDAGVENLRTISKIDILNKKIVLGKLYRGTGFPDINQRIVFWNTQPSGFANEKKEPIINTKLWKKFNRKSINFSSIVYDSLLYKWVMIFNECDTDTISIYGAMSENLTDWVPVNNGSPLLTANDFKNCTWAGVSKQGNVPQTPFVSDVIRYKNKWFMFMDGYSKDGKRNIGIAVSEKSVIGPYKITNTPIISPSVAGSWNDKSCFYAKIVKYKDQFLLFYDGKNNEGDEGIGLSYSNNLITWINYEYNPVLEQHTGWRSSTRTTEPNYIEVRGDSIFLMAAGVKKFKMGPWHHYITKRMYLDKSGNVDDTQLGVFLSTDGGKTFIAHKNNPVFTNDYSNKYENEHLGGNFKLIKTDTGDFIIYQAKSSFDGLKYNIMLRVKEK
jgi:hypothetical protein